MTQINKSRIEEPQSLVFLGTRMPSLSGSVMEEFCWTQGAVVRLICSAKSVRDSENSFVTVTVGADARRAARDGWPAHRIVATDIVPGKGCMNWPHNYCMLITILAQSSGIWAINYFDPQPLRSLSHSSMQTSWTKRSSHLDRHRTTPLISRI